MPKASKTASATFAAKVAVTEHRHWLLKAEPETRLVNGHDVRFSIDDLKDMKVSPWDGVRNYEARNNMKAMKKGDFGFFYHSNTKVPGIVGVLKIAKEAYPDYTAFDKKHPYYDAKSKQEEPRWFMVDVEYVRHLNRKISLEEIRGLNELENMALRKKSRLSVTPVTDEEWEFLIKLGDQKEEEVEDKIEETRKTSRTKKK